MLAHLAGSARCKSYSPYKEGAWRWSAGVQAAFANTLPMASFALAGHLSLGIIASPGAFTALYGTTMPLRVRLRALPFVTAGFVVAFVLGVLCADNASLSPAATAAKGDSALATTA